MKRFLLLPGLALAFTMCRPVLLGTDPNIAETNPFSDPALRSIRTLQDERNTNGLQGYLGHNSPALRREAALAFASVQDTTANPTLENLLTDPDDGVRSAAAYALGQTGGHTVAGSLAAALELERIAETRAALLEAYGKVTGTAGLDMLLLAQAADTVEQNGQQWGIYRAAMRGVSSPAAIEQVVQRLQTAPAYQTRLAAAHTLARLPGLDLSPYESSLAPLLTIEARPEVRAALASALSKMKSSQQSILLSSLATKDADYRVRLAAIRSMGSAPYAQVQPAVWKALDDPHPHVAQLAAGFLLNHGKTEKINQLTAKAKAAPNWQVQATLLQAALRYAPDKQRQPIRQELVSRYEKTTNVYEKAHLLKALAEDPESFSLISYAALNPPNKVLGTYATEALLLLRQHERFPEGLHELTAELLQRIVAQGDAAQAGSIATALRDPKANMLHDFSSLGFLKEAQQKLVLPRDMEAYLEIQKTLDLAEGQPGRPAQAPPFTNPIDWQQVLRLPADQRALISTSKGQVVLELLVQAAPASAANFAGLARQGFYDGKAFHRVVPNFVAQGGCPRGDGWGSTDYAIRSELAPLRYQTGYVGMASAGKDTESCQWFITHSPAPHLDGRYTIFARVVQGMEVVHLLEIGDIIESVVLL